MSRTPRPSVIGLLVAGALVLTGCGATTGASDDKPDGAMTVLASFYPLQYVVEQVGGDLVTVASLTPPGAEPHDLELSPRQVREVGDADVVVYLAGFQPAVDDAIAARRPEHLVDAASTAAVAAHMDAADDAEPDDAEAADGHDHDAGDPHFWLDPTLLAAVAVDVAVSLSAADPTHAAEFAAGANRLGADLAALDEEFTAGLASCERRVIVTSHAAFGFLAERYGLEQVGISGLDPESEPSPARLREIRAVVTEHQVTTLFTESLVNPKVAETLAGDLAITTAVLDPIESQADPGTDYRGAVDANLAALQKALGCS